VWTLVFAAGLGMVTVTAWLASRRLGAPTVTGLVLGAHLVACTEVIALTLALSTIGAVRPWTTLVGIGVIFVSVVASTRRSRTARVALVLGALRAVLSDPVVTVLAIAVAVGLAYSVALGLTTPPNDWDAMSYHLSRAALWIQEGAVAYVDDSPFAPINAYPPNAEIEALATLVLSDSDRFVGFVQYAAMLAMAAGTFGVARRIGIDVRGALFGALALLTLPLVLLQSWTALNDLVVASFLMAAAYFLLGTTRIELVLGATAVALALGTKFTAFVALPLLGLVILVGQPRRRWPGVLVSGLVGSAIGSFWLIVNVVETGRVDGGAADALDESADRSPRAVLAQTTRLLVHFADSMALERAVWLFPLTGLALIVVALIADRPPRRQAPLLAVGIVLVTAMPVAMRSIRGVLLRAHEKLWLTFGSSDLAFLDENRDPHSPSTVFSYFGSLGFLLTIAGVVLGFVAVRRRRAPPVVLALATAPVVFALLLSLAISYDPFRGRFFLFAVALSASTWGLALRHRWLSWGAVAIAVVTVPLAFVHSTEKPFPDVLGKPRETVQTWLRKDGTADVIAFFAQEPESGRVGLRIRPDDWIFPYSGRSLDREVVFVPDGPVEPSLDWLVVAPGLRADPGPRWGLAVRTDDGWRVYRAVTEPS
jgi:hypothetical protein